MEYAILQNVVSGETKAAYITGIDEDGIHGCWDGHEDCPELYDPQVWQVLYRGKKEEYNGPPPNMYEWN